MLEIHHATEANFHIEIYCAADLDYYIESIYAWLYSVTECNYLFISVMSIEDIACLTGTFFSIGEFHV